MKGIKVVAILVCGLVAFGVNSLLAQKWESMGKFKGNEHFEYEITKESKKDAKAEKIMYILDLKPAGEDYEVSYTTKGMLPKEKLGLETAFGLWGVFGISLNMVVLNPMYMAFFPQLELREGEKMSLWGAGLVKVVGKETVAGISGYIVEFYQTQNNEDKLVTKMTINKDYPLPLKSEVEDTRAVLIKYSEN